RGRARPGSARIGRPGRARRSPCRCRRCRRLPEVTRMPSRCLPARNGTPGGACKAYAMKRAAGASILGNGLGTGERREVRPPGNLSLVACVYPSDAHEHDSMTGEDPADRELVTAVAAGDEQAFAALYRRRRGDVYRFAYAMTRSAPFAQDMVQEVFLALLENAARYDPARGSVRAWLLGAARYAVLDRLRAERRFAVRDAAEEEPAAPCVGEEQVLAAQRLERLHAAILEL